MKVDYLIVGQGIAGTCLSWELEKRGKEYLVIDSPDPNAASRIAAGVINPITGRRLVKTWMADELLPYAEITFQTFGEQLGIEAIRKTQIIDFFPTLQMKLAFEERMNEEPTYLQAMHNPAQLAEIFNYQFGAGIVSPCYQVNLKSLLLTWRHHLTKTNRLRETVFDYAKLIAGDEEMRFEDIKAACVIFCDGASSYHNPYFPNLPFAANKGEAITFRCEGLPADMIYKKGMTIVPLEEDVFWIGSSYDWEFTDVQPSEIYRRKVDTILRDWLKLPYQVLDHRASLRPATLERRPFVGLHPDNKRLGIFNGMGTKGCSLAPYFASQFAEKLSSGGTIEPAADVARFRRVLSRNPL